MERKFFLRQRWSMFLMNLGLEQFKQCFVNTPSQDRVSPLYGMAELEETHSEWQCEIQCDVDKEAKRLLCCPEDIARCGRCSKSPNKAQICRQCQVPVCTRCYLHMREIARKQCFTVVPLGLCNDNFWGYTTSLLNTLNVRWIEAAIVNPYWTTMLVYYIEGDRGHLMDEVMAQQRSRTVVRGSACTYQMPWEEIVQDVHRNCHGREVQHTAYPRNQESLKYFIRVHMNVGGVDLKKWMKQIHVRPFVLLRLIDFLIDSKHEAYYNNKDCII